MPCNCDHLEPTAIEYELSKVACLLDELDGKPTNPTHWNGQHPRIYTEAMTWPKAKADKLVETLCKALQTTDVSKRSLEMQIWWRDHQEADRKRLIHEAAEAKQTADRQAVIARLAPHELELLGL